MHWMMAVAPTLDRCNQSRLRFMRPFDRLVQFGRGPLVERSPKQGRQTISVPSIDRPRRLFDGLMARAQKRASFFFTDTPFRGFFVCGLDRSTAPPTDAPRIIPPKHTSRQTGTHPRSIGCARAAWAAPPSKGMGVSKCVTSQNNRSNRSVGDLA